jgi:hypothetical protein
MHYHEEEYIFEERKTVGFPSNLGYSGYCYEKRAVSFINDFTYKMNNSNQKIVPLIPCFDRINFTPTGFAFLGHLMARGINFASKIDNFVEQKDINNMLISNLEDEEYPGYNESCGVLQLYNRKEKNIDAEDTTRVFYIRKLLGSQMVRASWNRKAFMTLLGLEREKDL